MRNSNGQTLSDWHVSERQWTRIARIGFARLMLKFAWAKNDMNDVKFYRQIIKDNELS